MTTQPASVSDAANSSRSDDAEGYATVGSDVGYDSVDDVVVKIVEKASCSRVDPGGYESIDVVTPANDATECDDFGYDSVDSVVKKKNGDHLPSLATLARTAEHIYDVVSENPTDPCTDYEDIREISRAARIDD